MYNNKLNFKAMKKKIFGGIAVAAIALTMALNVNISANNNSLSDISLANVEALAAADGDEGIGGSSYFPCTVSPGSECTFAAAYLDPFTGRLVNSTVNIVGYRKL